MKLKFFYFLLLLASLTILLGFKSDDKKGSGKITVNDNYTNISINNVLMWISNNGDGSHDPRTDGSGFYWPDGVKSAIFEDGLVFGAKIGDSILFNGNTHRQGLQAGKIINGLPDDPSLEKYRIYKIKRGWEALFPGPERDAFEKDYNEWPIEDGAPYIDIDEDGKPTPEIDKPQFIGDETLWYVSNDMDTIRTHFTYGSEPMGLEFQTTVYGYKTLAAGIGDAVFKKYKIINKGNNHLRDMYFGYWSDPDMGDANDDYIGCDTMLNMGYVFNATNSDGTYGTPPPAAGYTFLQGPIVPGGTGDSAKFLGSFRQGYKNLPMTSFVFYLGGSSTYRDPSQGQYSGSLEFYNYLQGKVWNGNDYIDPHTGLPVKYSLAGDPVSGTGWFEGLTGWPGGPSPGDRRFLLSSGPFNMAPGDTQEIVVAIHMALGYDNINSITELRNQSRSLTKLYTYGPGAVPDAPNLYSVTEDEKINLYWDATEEDYTLTDVFLPDTIKYTLAGMQYIVPVEDTTYHFEGYRIWQFKDLEGTEPKLLKIYDIQNDINSIYPYPFEAIRQDNQQLPFELLLVSPDAGLARFFSITKDAYTGSPLYNGSQYYFGITAYAYSKYSDPPILESVPQIIKVIPGKPAIDDNLTYRIGERIRFSQISGRGDANVEFQVVDPFILKDHNYKVEINGVLNPAVFRDTATSYNLIDITANDTIISNSKDFLTSIITRGEFKIPESEITNKIVYDGLISLVHQQGIDSIEWIDKAYPPSGKTVAVKGIYEVTGPEGILLPEPLPVFRQPNSTGEWQVDVSIVNVLLDPIQSLNFNNTIAIGYNDYEIRFTGTSQYYLLNYEQLFNSSPKAAGIVPFQVWNLGNNIDTIAKRLYIKIIDSDQDGQWSYIDSTQTWEPIYVFKTDTPYMEDVPNPAPPATAPARSFGRLVFKGGRPAEGTILRLEAWQPLSHGDVFEVKVNGPQLGNPSVGKENINNISVFPNPYYAASTEGNYPSYVRFTNLPQKVIIRIFSLAGVFIKKIEKDGNGQYIDWDLLNKDDSLISSGIYLVYLELPGIGTKIMKLAVVN